MSTIVTKLSWDPKILEPIFKELYDLAMRDKKNFIPLMYQETNSTKDTESYEGVGGEGLMEEWKYSNNQVFYDNVDELWQKYIRNRKWSDGREIEFDLVDDMKLTSLRNKITSMADAVYKTQQLQAVEFLVNAFDTTGPNFRRRTENYAGPDGQPLCSESHPYSPKNDSDVQSNKGTSPLTIDAWDETAVKMQEWVDDRGNPMACIPDTVIVAPYNARAAFHIAGLPESDMPKWEPDSSNYNVNIYNGQIKVIVNPFIHPSKRRNWFAVDSARLKRFNIWQWRRRPENGNITDFDTEILKYKVIGRWAYGFLNYSFIYGHEVPES